MHYVIWGTLTAPSGYVNAIGKSIAFSTEVSTLMKRHSAVDDIYGTQKCAGNQPVHSSLRRKFSGYPKAIRIFVWQLNTVGGQLK